MALVNENQGIIHKICRIYAAENQYADLFQDIMVSLWKGFNRFKGNAKPTTWMYRVALYTAMNHRRYSVLRKHAPLEGDYGASESIRQREEANETVYTALKALKPENRALMMLYLEEHSYQDISDILGISVSNVGARISRTKEKLKTIIQSL